MRIDPMNISKHDQGDGCLARAWALLAAGEHLARGSGEQKPGPGLWLLAANAILRARDCLEAIHPCSASAGGDDAVPQWPDMTCSELVAAAAQELASIPPGLEPPGLSLALYHLVEASGEVAGRCVS
jgi:hypothetical protein